MTSPSSSGAMLEALQRDRFSYFLDQANPANGLVSDTTEDGAPASIAVVGFALAAYPVGVERGFWPRAEAVARTLTTLRFFSNSSQGTEPDATGYKGFYYHFLDMQTGRRVRKSELSTIDTTFLLAGVLTAAAYFDREAEDEAEIRALADALYRRVDWTWAQNGGTTVTHGWRPESGFLTFRWEGYDETLLLYVLGLGSPTYPLPEESYAAWTSTFAWTTIYGHEFLYAGPLFIHQFSHLWIDFRAIQDEFMRSKSIDYFENSRRATYLQQEYAVRNPLGFKGYGKSAWGLTASDGPGPESRRIDGVERSFFGYRARGVPDGPDDGTLAPWASSLRYRSRRRSPSRPFGIARSVSGDSDFLRLHRQLQSHLPLAVRRRGGLGLPRALRPQSGPQRLDDRELPFGLGLAAHAPLPLHRHGVAPGRICEWLAVTDTSALAYDELSVLPNGTCNYPHGGFAQSYNAQAGVDTQTMLVVTAHVTQATNDKREIAPVLDKVQSLPQALGQVTALLADTGYFSAANVQACESRLIEPMLAMKRESHHIPVLERFAADAPVPESDDTV